MKSKTLFDNVSALQARPIIESMIDDFMIIVSNDNMSKAINDCFGDLKVPEGKTQKEYFAEIDGNGRISRFLRAVMDYAYEPTLRILSKLFCTDYDKYCKKSLNKIAKDMQQFAKSPFLGFFISAIMSTKVK